MNTFKTTLFVLMLACRASAQFVMPPFFGSTGHTGFEAWPTNIIAWDMWQTTRAWHTNAAQICATFPDAGFGISTQFRLSVLTSNRMELTNSTTVISNVVVTNFAGVSYWQASNAPVVVVSTNGSNWLSTTNIVLTGPCYLAVTNGPGIISNLAVTGWIWPLPMPTNSTDTTWGTPGMVRWESNALHIATGSNRWSRVYLTGHDSSPRWVDALASGTTLSKGASAPETADLPGGWTTAGQGFRYGVGDYASFGIQTPHVLATTNHVFQHFYYEPHIHISVVATNGTNATFVLEWQTGVPGSVYTHEIRTNTVGMSTNRHAILSWGYVTNDSLQGGSSVVFRGAVKRLASPAQDVGSSATEKVFIDSLDFHVPVRVLGSGTVYSGE